MALCASAQALDDVPSDLNFLALCALEVEGEEPPEWVQLIPAGAKVEAFDGRRYKNPNPQGVIDLFQRNGLSLPFDIEHSTHLKAPKGEPAPAVGWIKALELREGSVWGKVDWNADGRTALMSKSYKYASPGFYHDREGNITGLASAGLTNKPALKLVELAHERGGSIMDKELLALLGLKEDATKEEVLAACSELKKVPEELKAKVEELQTSLKAKDTELATAREEAKKPGAVDLKNVVPRADYDLALNRISELEKDNKERKLSLHNEKVEAALDKALKAGKIAPSTVEIHRKGCATQEGLDLFQELMEKAPVVVTAEEIVTGNPPGSDGKMSLNAEERKFIKVMGLTEEEYRAGAAEA